MPPRFFLCGVRRVRAVYALAVVNNISPILSLFVVLSFFLMFLLFTCCLYLGRHVLFFSFFFLVAVGGRETMLFVSEESFFLTCS